MDYVKKFLNVEGIIGQGAFGKVLVSSPLQIAGSRFALKCVHPILKPQRLANELRHLRDLGGQCNVVQMHTAHFFMGSLYIVMELIEHTRFVDIVAQLDYMEIVMYMKNLLISLEHVHAHNIMHRDIKPANFLYNRKDKNFLLVDFGLAQTVRPRSALFTSRPSTKRHLPEAQKSENFHRMFKKLRVLNNEEVKEPIKLTVGAYESPVTHNDSISSRRNIQSYHIFSTPTLPSRQITRVRCECRGKAKTCSTCLTRPDPNAPKSGTPGFKAPEILLRYPNQTTAIDIWSAGVILACLLSGHSPFFRDVDDNVSLAEIITIIGSQRVTQAAKALGIRLIIEPRREPIELKQLVKTIRLSNQDKRQIEIPDSAFDLLNRMLDPNPMTRITASEALKHDWFEAMIEV